MAQREQHEATNLESWKVRRSSGSHPMAGAKPAAAASTAGEPSTEELEIALIDALRKMDQSGQLPGVLREPFFRFELMQREVRTHRRHGMVMGHDEYRELEQSLPLARTRLVDLCLSHKLFG